MPDLPIPLEVPWQLLATTQPLEDALPPNRSTMSLFAYVPDLPTLPTDYPDDRLVYLKFSVSISPEFPDEVIARGARLWSTAFAPVWHVLLDVRIASEGGAPGIRPFFLDAAPLRRTMRETGVLGNDVYEGESDGLSMGKSGAQLHESFRTSSGTDTSGWGAGISSGLSLGGGSSVSTTTGDRSVVQTVDTTSREASQERRELSSHLTNVENVFSLLTGLYVGTPYLRFSLWPQPLHALTRDPTNDTQWYAELLRRRSSGIEGVQDFYAIAAIPRADLRFCVHASLKRFVLGEPPLPDPDDVEAPDELTDVDRAQVLAYLHRRYPRGTPVDDLDVDLLTNEKIRVRRSSMRAGGDMYDGWIYSDQTDEAVAGLRPAMWAWDFAIADGGGNHPTADLSDLPDNQIVQAIYGYAVPKWNLGNFLLDDPSGGPRWEREADLFQIAPHRAARRATYKTTAEVWRDMRLAEYHDELLRSPLERGTIIVRSTQLDTCAGIDAAGKISALPGGSSTDASGAAQFDPPSAKVGPGSGVGADRYRRAAVAWNLATQALVAQAHAQPEQAAPLRLSDDDLVQQYLVGLRARGRADAGNQALAASPWLNLPPPLHQKLAAMAVDDLYDLAGAILYAPRVAALIARPPEVLEGPPEQPAAPTRPRSFTRRVDRALVWLRARAQTWRTGQAPPSTRPTPATAPPAPPPPQQPPPPRPMLTGAEIRALREAIGAGLEARFGTDTGRA